MSSVLSLGSNLGDRLRLLRDALDVLEPDDVSGLWETAPVGGVEQPDFLNLVVRCRWDAEEAWRRGQRAETQAGRTRGADDVRWGPRTLDVDVIVADGSAPGLVLPHPRAFERAFVLLPWLELEPDAVLPGHGRIAELPAALDPSGVTRVGELP